MSNDPILTEKELENIFAGKPARVKKRNWKGYLYSAISFMAIAILIYILLNFNTLRDKLSYWYENEYKTADISQSLIPSKLNEATTQESAPPMDNIANNFVHIPLIPIDAPIVWDVQNTPEEMKTALEKGVAQVRGTAHPGETGNIFITGHSSNYPWAKGSYNNIFALLDKLSVGDKVQIKYEGVNYLYVIKEIKVVAPNDTSVMQPTSSPILTLMTCTPVGTSLRRLIVIADQAYPDPAKNKSIQQNKIQATQIPAAR